MNVGSVSNFNYIAAAGRVNSPMMRNTAPPNSKNTSPVSAAPVPQTQGTNALYFSPDGDRAEISNRARGLSFLEPAKRPVDTGIITNYPFNLPSARINWDIININPFLPSSELNIPAPAALPAVIPNLNIQPGNNSDDSDQFALVENDMLEALDPQGACETCKNRKYVDQSDDASVSFQTPTNISPSMAGAAVAAHEQEHVRNEQANAQRDGREIVSQSVSLTYATCPECGKHYVSGGTTRTTSVSKSESDDSEDMPEIGSSPGGDTPDEE